MNVEQFSWYGYAGSLTYFPHILTVKNHIILLCILQNLHWLCAYHAYLEQYNAIVKVIVEMADERIGSKTVHPVTESYKHNV